MSQIPWLNRQRYKLRTVLALLPALLINIEAVSADDINSLEITHVRMGLPAPAPDFSIDEISLGDLLKLPVVKTLDFYNRSPLPIYSVHSSRSSSPIPTDFLSSTSREEQQNTLRILSLDGGGVRGLMEARFLQQLEANTGKSTSEMFHLIGGTSAGGLISAALTLPEGQGDPKKSRPRYSADYLFNVLNTSADSVFEKKWSFGGLAGPRYKSEPVEKFIGEYFGDATFDRTTNDALAVAYNLSARQPKIFKSWDSSEIFYTRDVLLATSAAPVYFSPRFVKPVNAPPSHTGYALSDGGTCANNPTACLLAEARRLYPEVNNYEIVSLGTGNGSKPLYFDKMKEAGILGWSTNLVDMFMNGQSTATHYLMGTLFKERGYSRWNPDIDEKNVALDNTSEHNLIDLKEAEDRLIASRRQEFDQLAKRLTQPKDDLLPIYLTSRKQ